MKRNLFSLLSIMLLLSLVFTPLRSVEADDSGAPVVGTISIAGYDGLDDAFGQVGKMLGNPQLQLMFRMLDSSLGDEIMDVLSKDKPLGAALYYDANVENSVYPLIFLPISDSAPIFLRLGELMTSIRISDCEYKDIELTKIEASEVVLYVRTVGAWTFLSTIESALVSVPADPVALLGDLPKKYTIGMEVKIDKIPADAKQWVLDKINEGAEAASTLSQLETDAVISPAPVKDLQEQSQKMQLDQIKDILDNSSNLVIGLGFDSANEIGFGEMNFTVKTDSGYADLLKKLDGQKPDSTFFFEDAVVTGGQISVEYKNSADQVKQLIDSYKDIILGSIQDAGVDEAEKPELEKLVSRTTNLVSEMTQASVDNPVGASYALFFSDEDLSAALSVKGFDAVKIDTLTKDWIKFADKDGETAEYIKFDSEKWEGLTFATFSFPISQIKDSLTADEDIDATAFIDFITDIYGEKIELAYAFDNNSFYMAVGNKPVELIKKGVKNTATIPEGLNSYSKVRVGKLALQMAALPMMDGNEQKDMIEAIGYAAEGEDEQDAIIVKTFVDGNTQVSRIEAQKGIFRAVQAMAMMLMLSNM